MMKKLTLSWDGIQDSTGYMFSFAKALCLSLIHIFFPPGHPFPQNRRAAVNTASEDNGPFPSTG